MEQQQSLGALVELSPVSLVCQVVEPIVLVRRLSEICAVVVACSVQLKCGVGGTVV